MSISDKLDEEFFFRNPVVGISVNVMGKVFAEVEINLEGKNFTVQLKEYE